MVGLCPAFGIRYAFYTRSAEREGKGARARGDQETGGRHDWLNRSFITHVDGYWWPGDPLEEYG